MEDSMRDITKFFNHPLILFLLLLTVIGASSPSGKAGKGQREFYLTKDEAFTGAQALNACAEGYHMASLWEIFDTSNFKYNITLGLTSDDSGSGPPSGTVGWIHTGAGSSGQTEGPGLDNCFAWTSSSSSDNGTRAYLIHVWETFPSARLDPWATGISNCDLQQRVWCVQD
jgi:hypothetical protein